MPFTDIFYLDKMRTYSNYKLRTDYLKTTVRMKELRVMKYNLLFHCSKPINKKL